MRQSRPPIPRALLLLALALVAGGTIVAFATGATPSEGEISQEQPTTTWAGKTLQPGGSGNVCRPAGSGSLLRATSTG